MKKIMKRKLGVIKNKKKGTQDKEPSHTWDHGCELLWDWVEIIKMLFKKIKTLSTGLRVGKCQGI